MGIDSFFKTKPSDAKSDFISPTKQQKREEQMNISSSEDDDDKSDACVGQLVWAKLEGFAWWPAMVCDDPVSHRCIRTSRTGIEKVHVQFFEKPPTRAWTPKQYTTIYTLSTGEGAKYVETGDKGQEEACKAANECTNLSQTECLEKLLVEDDVDKENDAKGEDKKRKFEELEVLKNKREKRKKSNPLDSESDYEPDQEEEEASSKEEAKEADSPPPRKRAKTNKSITPRPTTNPKQIVYLNEPVTPGSQKVTKLPSTPVTPITKPALSSPSLSSTKLAKFTRPDGASETTYLHHSLEWLKPGKISDKERRRENNPDYDCKTLHVPTTFLNACTPGMQQWWQIKSDHYDAILFFKVGKFYEFYHMDAEVGVKELGLIFMKGNFAHCGFPEKAFGRYSETLVQKGYRVARIEQTSRPDTKAKGSKTVNREVCAVITKGTKTHSYLEGQSPEVTNSYLMSVCEEHGQYGVCLIDTSVGLFQLTQFSDDRHCSRLRTLIAHFPIVQVLYPRRDISPKLQSILKTELSQALHEPLTKEKQFWSAGRTMKELSGGKYFVPEGGEDAEWPDELTKMTVNETGSFNEEISPQYSLSLSALGAAIYYLKSCLIERPLLVLKRFKYFNTTELIVRGQTFPKKGQKLVMDNTTMANLEILQSSEGTVEGSLLYVLDKCVTPAGKRLLRQWLCAPLCEVKAINNRLDALDNLLKYPGKVKQVQNMLRKVPDLERLLRKIHTLGTLVHKDHPDSRAVLYEEENYSKKKIMDLVSCLEGFQTLCKVMSLFEELDLTSSLLIALVSDGFPDLTQLLTFYNNCFDREEALAKGTIVPTKGVNKPYDTASEELKRLELCFTDLAVKYKRELGCSVNYWGTGKNRYTIEVPDSAGRKVPSSWVIQSQRKGYLRYFNPEIIRLKEDLTATELRREAALKDTMRLLFNKFSSHYNLWNEAVQCSATLDVLLSLAHYSASDTTCRPVLTVQDMPLLEIREGSHPTILPTFSNGGFIPNDTVLGGQHKVCLVVTGPNMGGKSTLMRQVGLLVILAQIGSYVPATAFRLTPVDRIFTRLGASDNITKGESTFFVEMSETSSILCHASHHSLVLLDELGRGTATYDGTAIAGAVIQNICQSIGCRTLFSTHYHRLVDELGKRQSVALGHMSCMSDEGDEDNITFLYKLAPGACPKSFGFNAARLAGLPVDVISEARGVASQFESMSDNFHLFKEILKKDCNINTLCAKLPALVL